MAPDYKTLLLAIGLSGMCLAATLFASWLSARVERFLLAWSLGVTCIVLAVATYGFYVEHPKPLLGSLYFALQFAGFAFIYGAAYRFRTARSARGRIVLVFALCMAPSVPFMLTGLDGVAFIAFNVVVAAVLAATAGEYWKGREEARLPLTGISILYMLTAISFLLCAGVLVEGRSWVLGGAPSNWAEDLNLVMAIVGITGIGAMSLAVNQWRIAGSNRRAAMTDALTGLLNRRALFDRYGENPLGPHAAVIAFDLDNFKRVNDRHGHAAGDAVLRVFARVMMENMPTAAIAARLGGEEFALVLDRAPPDRVAHVAESVRAAFAREPVAAAGQTLSCTVSAGIAFAGAEPLTFDALLAVADKALYASKQAGRNRVSALREVRRSA